MIHCFPCFCFLISILSVLTFALHNVKAASVFGRHLCEWHLLVAKQCLSLRCIIRFGVLSLCVAVEEFSGCLSLRSGSCQVMPLPQNSHATLEACSVDQTSKMATCPPSIHQTLLCHKTCPICIWRPLAAGTLHSALWRQGFHAPVSVPLPLSSVFSEPVVEKVRSTHRFTSNGHLTLPVLSWGSVRIYVVLLGSTRLRDWRCHRAILRDLIWGC